MSPLILTTRKDFAYDVELAGVGTMGAFGRGGLPADEAAKTVREFQGDDGEPLSGKQLESAVREFAEARGLTVRSVKDLDDATLRRLREEAGAIPRHPTIEEHSRAIAERDQAQAAPPAEGGPILDQSEVPVQETSLAPPAPIQTTQED